MKKQQTLDKTKSKYTIDQFNIDDEVEFMCIGIEATGKVTSISYKNKYSGELVP
jgi:ribosomal protein S1